MIVVWSQLWCGCLSFFECFFSIVMREFIFSQIFKVEGKFLHILILHVLSNLEFIFKQVKILEI